MFDPSPVSALSNNFYGHPLPSADSRRVVSYKKLVNKYVLEKVCAQSTG